MALVLVVDDDAMVAHLVARIVQFCRHEPLEVMDPLAAAQRVTDRAVRCVLSDYMMPKLDGIELLTIFHDQRPDVRRVLITAAPREQAVEDARKSGVVQAVIAKPPSIADIEQALAWL
jgi:CheY-like chemotaxis protein